MKKIGGNDAVSLVDMGNAKLNREGIYAGDGWYNKSLFTQKEFWGGLESEMAHVAGINALAEMPADRSGSKGDITAQFVKSGKEFGVITHNHLSGWPHVTLQEYAEEHPVLRNDMRNRDLFYSDDFRCFPNVKLSKLERAFTPNVFKSLIQHNLKSSLMLDLGYPALEPVKLGGGVFPHDSLFNSMLQGPSCGVNGEMIPACEPGRIEEANRGVAQNIEWLKERYPNEVKEFFAALASSKKDMIGRMNFDGLEEYAVGKEPGLFVRQDPTAYLQQFGEQYRGNFERQVKNMQDMYRG